MVAVPRRAALHHQQAQSPGEREGRGCGGGEERAPRGPHPRPRPVHREARPPLQVRLQLRQGVLGGEGAPVHRLCAATPRWGARRHRAGSIPPSKIPGEHPFWVHDTLQCGCTRLPGLHPSSGTAPVSQGCIQILECTRLWEQHPTLGAAPISQGVPISWGALILRSCTHLQGLHPSVGAISPLSGGHTYLLGCTHLQGMHPSCISRWAPISGYRSCGAGLGGDAQAAAQPVPGGVPMRSLGCLLGSCWHPVLLSPCPRHWLRHTAVRASAAPPPRESLA